MISKFAGVTLIEWLIVVVIFAILGAIAFTHTGIGSPCEKMYNEARSHSDTLTIDGMHPNGLNSYSCVVMR